LVELRTGKGVHRLIPGITPVKYAALSFGIELGRPGKRQGSGVGSRGSGKGQGSVVRGQGSVVWGKESG